MFTLKLNWQLNMGNRSVNRLGWGTRDTDLDEKVAVTNADTTPDYLNPKIAVAGAGFSKAVLNAGGNEQLELTIAPSTILNTAIPYGSFFIPAGSMTPGAEKPFAWEDTQIGAQDQAFRTIVFPPDQSEDEAYFTFATKSNEMDTGDIQFIFQPVWFQKADSSAPSPTEYVSFHITLSRFGYDDDMNINLDPVNASVEIVSAVLDQWHLAYGHTSSGNEYGGRILQADIQGTNPSTGNLNLWQVMLERQSNDGDDTYDENIHCLGLACQYKTDFGNIAQWPNVTS